MNGIPELLFWSDIALEAGRAEQSGDTPVDPARATQALATVHLAMYDAYVAVAKPADFAPHLPGLPAVPAGASVPAAIAGAAHEVLSVVFPGQRGLLDRKLVEAGLASGDPGESFGRAVAAVLLGRPVEPDPGAAEPPPSGPRGRHPGGLHHGAPRAHASLHGARRRQIASTRRALVDPPFDGRDRMRALRDLRGSDPSAGSFARLAFR